MIFEVLPIKNSDKNHLSQKISRSMIIKTIKNNELLTLKQDALVKVLLGKISYQDYKEL